MNHHQDAEPPQLPRITEWVTGLFLPADIAEAILGDIEEEFARLADKSGSRFARACYHREALSAVLHAVANAFSSAPILMLVTLVGGLWFIGFATNYTLHAMRMVLDASRVYEHHPDWYLFWLKFPAETGRVILCAVVGAAAALAAKRKEIPAVTALAFAQIVMFCSAAIPLAAHGRDWFPWFVTMAPWNVLCAVATVAGGAIIRKRRSYCSRQLTSQ